MCIRDSTTSVQTGKDCAPEKNSMELSAGRRFSSTVKNPVSYTHLDAGMLAAVAAGAYGDGRIRRNEQSAHIDICLLYTSQCLGAGEKDQAVYYSRRLMLFAYCGERFMNHALEVMVWFNIVSLFI